MAPADVARRVRFLFGAIRRHGASHAVEVLRQARRRGAFAAHPPPLPDEHVLREELGNDWLTSLTETVAARFPLLKSARKEFFLSLVQRDLTMEEILEEADRFANGVFSALGASTPGGAYDWHRDWVSGHTWPRAPYDQIRFVGSGGSDVKLPWELSRMYWISWLARAWHTTGNSAWARDFTRTVDSWIEANPPYVGVNWAMPMEVGIRAYWMTQGFVLFRSAPAIESDWWSGYVRVLYAHGTYLEHNLEYFSNLTNHYIANLLGLVALGTFFGPESPAGRRWLERGRRGLIEEFEHQVCADGTHYERSLPYHRLVTEMYLIAATLLDRCGVPFDSASRKRLHSMCDLLADTMLPDGSVPMIGDADDGVILRMHSTANPRDVRGLLALAACLFEDRRLAAAAGAFGQEALWLLGAEGFETFRALHGEQPDRASVLYRDGGFASLRHAGIAVVADVGPIGLHGNNDTLSFVLSTGYGPVVVDPGTYSYTGDPMRRNELRSSSAHNGLVVDGAEIAEFDGLWRVRRDGTRTRVRLWEAGAEHTTLEAEHHAYERLGAPVVRRRWDLDADGLRVVDTVEGTGTHRLTLRLTLDPAVGAEQVGGRRVRLRPAGPREIEWEFDRPVNVATGWMSPRYGVAVETVVIELVTVEALPVELVYICRFASPNPA